MLTLSPEDAQTVSRAPLFVGIEGEAVMTLVDAAAIVAYPEASLLFSKGDVADRFFLVLAGRVNLFALTEGGDQSIIEVFETGWTFAEAGMFSSGRYPLNCEVAAGTRLLHIPASPFLKRLAEHPDLAFKMLAALSRWQRRLLGEISDLKNKSPGQRLGSFLLAFSTAGDQGGSASARLPLTKAQLASRIGIAPESLSRAILRLRAVGVESRGRDIVINDVEALRRFCGQSGSDWVDA